MDCLNDLSYWFRSHCNGDREHIYGISVTTLDNPGWEIRIDLKETNLEIQRLHK